MHVWCNVSGLRLWLHIKPNKAWRSASACCNHLVVGWFCLRFIVHSSNTCRSSTGSKSLGLLWLKWEGLCWHREHSVLTTSLQAVSVIFESQFRAVVYLFCKAWSNVQCHNVTKQFYVGYSCGGRRATLILLKVECYNNSFRKMQWQLFLYLKVVLVFNSSGPLRWIAWKTWINERSIGLWILWPGYNPLHATLHQQMTR